MKFTALLLLLTINILQVNAQDLNQKIFELNNNFKYKESQEILLDIINNSNNNKKKFKACILLSHTYKRLYDYFSTKKYLEKAYDFADNKEEKNKLKALLSMVLFDTKKYEESKELMLKLEETKYRGLSEEDKAIIIMQLGYVNYLEKKHPQAKTYYLQSLGIMKKNPSDCNQPIVYGKMFRLYSDLKQYDSIDPLYKKGMNRAQECDVLKYKIYLTNEYIKAKNEVLTEKEKYIINNKLDSLKRLYAPLSNTIELINSEHETLDQSLKKEKKEKKNYLIIVLISLALFFTTAFISRSNRKKRKILEIENKKINLKLKEYINSMNKSDKDDIGMLLKNNKLSNRQKEILNLLLKGKSNKEIANEIHITENTVKYHVKNIYKIISENNIKIERKAN